MTTATALSSPSLAPLSLAPGGAPQGEVPTDPDQGAEFAFLLAGLVLPPAVVTPPTTTSGPTTGVTAGVAAVTAVGTGPLGAGPAGPAVTAPLFPPAPRFPPAPLPLVAGAATPGLSADLSTPAGPALPGGLATVTAPALLAAPPAPAGLAAATPGASVSDAADLAAPAVAATAVTTSPVPTSPVTTPAPATPVPATPVAATPVAATPVAATPVPVPGAAGAEIPASTMTSSDRTTAGPAVPAVALTAAAAATAGGTTGTDPAVDPDKLTDPATAEVAPSPSDVRIALRTAQEVAAPTAVAAPPVASQVVQVLTPVLLGAEGAYSLSLRLLPEDLGEIHVEVQVQGSTVVVRLTSDNPMTQEALRAALPDLRDALAAEGLTASSLEVGDGRQQPRQDQAQPQRALDNTRTVPQPDPAASILPRPAGVAAGLDLRL